MTETSFFHNGSMRGDGVLSPYTSKKFQELWSVITNSATINGAIDNNDYTNLGVSASGTDMEVDIAVGSAFIEGIYFDNDATVAIELDTGGPRYDRIVVRVNWEEQQARFAVVKGETGSPPTPPELQQDAGIIYEFPLARVYIADGATVINQRDITTEVVFIPTAQSIPNIDIMNNGSFMYGAQNQEIPPPYWTVTGSPTITTQAHAGRHDLPYTFGNLLYVKSNTGDILGTELYTSNASSILYPNLARATIAFYMRVLSGSIEVKLGGVNVYTAYPIAETSLYLIYTSASSLNNDIILTFEGEGNYYLYPITISFGLSYAPFIRKRELTLSFNPRVNYTLTRTSATPTVNITRTNLIGTYPPLGRALVDETAIMLKQTVLDSGSSGTGSVFAAVGDNHIRTELGILANSTKRHSIGTLYPIRSNLDSGRYTSESAATGADTMQQDLSIIGVVT